MEDKRLTHRLSEYWKRIRKDAPLPKWEHLNISAISDVWGQCCVWKVEISHNSSNPNIYTYEYVGKSTKEAFGVDATGETLLLKFKNFPAAKLAKNIDSVVEKHLPEFDEGKFINEQQKIVKYRSCMLPFGTADGNVTHILLGLSWKAF